MAGRKKEAEKREDPEKKVKFWARAASGVAGVGFLVLAGVDAAMDPFPGPETFFATTGITLLGIAMSGQLRGGKGNG